MARPLRIIFPGAFYHITARGNEQKAIFKSKRDREKFLEYLSSATERYSAVIHAFCLMDNHYHLLLETPLADLPQIMRHINGAYTTYFNIKRARNGHLFQGRYKAILVQKDAYAKELTRYIHLNPVRAQMAKTPADYHWSSYKAYIGATEAPDWLHCDFILAYFGQKRARAQKGYRDFVMALVDRKYESPLIKATGTLVLGSTEFIKSIKERYLGDQKSNRDIPALRQIHKGLSMGTVMDLVAEALQKHPRQIRNASIYLCRKHTGQKLRNIGKQFGISDAAVSQVCKRFRKRMESDQNLEKTIAKIEKKLIILKVET